MTLAPDIDTFDVTTCNTNTVHNVYVFRGEWEKKNKFNWF